MRLEIVVTDTSEAKVAERSGASRVELVAEFDRGGLTPDDRLISEVTGAVSIPVHVILRPHDDGFVYGAAEQREILEIAARMRDLGAAAIVFGALDKRGRIAADLVRQVASAGGLPVTFHRAFDSVLRFSAAYSLLSGIAGVERVLTAGGSSSAWDGRTRLRELTYGNTTPTVVGAGAIDAENVAGLLEFTGLQEVHVGRGARTEGKVDPRKIERLVALVCGGTPP